MFARQDGDRHIRRDRCRKARRRPVHPQGRRCSLNLLRSIRPTGISDANCGVEEGHEARDCRRHRRSRTSLTQDLLQAGTRHRHPEAREKRRPSLEHRRPRTHGLVGSNGGHRSMGVEWYRAGRREPRRRIDAASTMDRANKGSAFAIARVACDAAAHRPHSSGNRSAARLGQRRSG